MEVVEFETADPALRDPAVDRDDTRKDVASALLRLGASAKGLPAGSTPETAGITPREFASALGWLGVGALFLGWLLHVVLVALPRWIAGLWA